MATRGLRVNRSVDFGNNFLPISAAAMRNSITTGWDFPPLRGKTA